MKTLSLLLLALVSTLPAYTQKIPKVNITGVIHSSTKAIPQLAPKVSGAVARNGYKFSVGLTRTPAKQILNKHYQFVLESNRAAQLYKQLRLPQISPAQIRQEIEQTIVNNTLRTSLLENLDRGDIAAMEQDLSQYFLLDPQNMSFAQAANRYLQNHPHKPTWRLREAIQFGGKNSVEPPLLHDLNELSTQAASVKNTMTVDETQKLFSLYHRADELNAVIKAYIAQDTHTAQETSAFLDTLQEMQALYEELLAFARNSYSVQSTIQIYQKLLEDVEAVVAKHHRLPLITDPEERELALLFEPLVFHTLANQFEEIIPILTKLYELTEKYPANRFSEREAFFHIENFYNKHGFLPRSVQSRDFFDARTQEALLFEALTYWTQNSPAFVQKINKLVTP